MRGENDKNKGKRNNQKLKPYLVLQILLKKTDETNCMDSYDIVTELAKRYGVAAENRSIYRDIADINKALCAEEYGCDLDEAAEAILEDEENKAIRYNAKYKGFHIVHRKINLNDARFSAKGQRFAVATRANLPEANWFGNRGRAFGPPNAEN